MSNSTEKIILLPKTEAVIVLTELILLWEIYANLFVQPDTFSSKVLLTFAPNTHGITLPYFKTLNYSVNNWIEQTKDAGFKQKAEFATDIQATLHEIFPKEDNLQPSKFSIAMQKIRSSVNNTADYLKVQTQDAGAWFKQTWKNIKTSWTRERKDLIEELDEL